MSPSDAKTGPILPSETTKGIVSLAIILHLCCVLTVLASNFRRSELLDKLVFIYSPYTQLLNLDPNQTPHYLTLGRPEDDDAVLSVDLYADADTPVTEQKLLKTDALPGGESRWLANRRRYLALAKVVMIHSPVDRELDDYEMQVTTEIAKDVGRRLMEENGARRAVLRCVRRMSQPRRLADLDPGFPPENPRAAAYDVTLLTTDVWIDDEGETQAARRAARSELAPLRREPAR
jgi:hypothetical protein